MKATEDDPKLKLRVTMLTWDKSDQWVITASSDNSIKVWNSVTGDLIQILNGHRAETYVIESHPLDSKVSIFSRTIEVEIIRRWAKNLILELSFF